MVRTKTTGASAETRYVCAVVDGCGAPAVLQAPRSCSSCTGNAGGLRAGAQQRRRELDLLELHDEEIKAAARARDGACGCGDPSSHDGSPAASAKKAKAAADYVTRPAPCPRPLTGDLTDLEVFELKVSAGRRRDLGEDAVRLEAAAEAVARSHTHPVFACAEHVPQLP